MGASNSSPKSVPQHNQTPFVTYKQIKSQLKPGDLIEIQRDGYNHWVLFEKIEEGNGCPIWCFHVNSDKQNAFSKKVILKYEALEEILKDNNCEKPSLCRVNNKEDRAQEKLERYGQMRPDNLNKVFTPLRQQIGKSFEYNLLRKNCEYYCTLWKYGIGWTDQVSFKNVWEFVSTKISNIWKKFAKFTKESLKYFGFSFQSP